MLDIFLIRHAESEGNLAAHLISGQSNHLPLSPLGRIQAQLLGKRLHHEKIQLDQVFCSTALRARDTALIACEQIAFPASQIQASDLLLEIDQGDWVGRERKEIYTPEMRALINADNWNFKAPNGESQQEVEERMLNFVNKQVLPAWGEGKKVAVFTHGVAIKCLLRGILGFAPSMTYKLVVNNTSITRLQYDQIGWHFHSLNDCGHLNQIGYIDSRMKV